MTCGLENFQGAASEHRMPVAHRDEPLQPAQERGLGTQLRRDIDRLMTIDRVEDGRTIEPFRGEA
ncbi:MAG: hypothetical protein ACRERD_15410 [Candidatus Binatia bacterium]